MINRFRKQQVSWEPSRHFAGLRSIVGLSGIMTLWKHVLLRSRVLFLGEPPVGALCHLVYSTALLGLCAEPLATASRPQPLFFVNLADTPTFVLVSVLVKPTPTSFFLFIYLFFFFL